MSNKFNLLAVLSLYLAGTNVVYALSCKNGTSSCSTQSAADCTNLGYSADNIKNCKHYLYCPFNTSYKTCVAFDNSEPEPDCADYPLTIECPENSRCVYCPADSSYKKLTGCKTGYTKSVDECGKTGEDGWILKSKDSNGCGKCTEKACSGNTKYTSVNKCGSSGNNGWNYTSCYYGDELLGTCTARSCPRGASTDQICNSALGLKKVSTSRYSGNELCYKCVQSSSTCFKTEVDCKAGTYCNIGCSVVCRYDSSTKCYYGNEVCLQPGTGL